MNYFNEVADTINDVLSIELGDILPASRLREVGFDAEYANDFCWHNSADMSTIYDDDPDFKEPEKYQGWEKFGYKDRWVTVMVALTEKGAEQYLELDGHNVKRQAFRNQVRIYVDSFHRCPEMIAIREELMKTGEPNG